MVTWTASWRTCTRRSSGIRLRASRTVATTAGSTRCRRNVFDPLHEEWWEEFSAEPEEFIDAGAHVLVLGRYVGRAKGTGRRLDVPYAHLWTLREGKAVCFRQFLDTRGWVEALATD